MRGFDFPQRCQSGLWRGPGGFGPGVGGDQLPGGESCANAGRCRTCAGTCLPERRQSGEGDGDSAASLPDHAAQHRSRAGGRRTDCKRVEPDGQLWRPENARIAAGTGKSMGGRRARVPAVAEYGSAGGARRNRGGARRCAAAQRQRWRARRARLAAARAGDGRSQRAETLRAGGNRAHGRQRERLC